MCAVLDRQTHNMMSHLALHNHQTVLYNHLDVVFQMVIMIFTSRLVATSVRSHTP